MSSNKSLDESGGSSYDAAVAEPRRPGTVGVLVSVAALLAVILHVAEPSWKIDSVAIALLLVAALPWLGDILESISFPGGGSVQYRKRLQRVEVKAADVEWQVAKQVTDLLPLLLPQRLVMHLRNLEGGRTDHYFNNETLPEELRQLRTAGLIQVLPGRSIAEIPEGEVDLADYVQLTEAGHRLARAYQIGPRPRPPQ